MPLEQRYKDWLGEVGKAAGARINWARTEKLKAERLAEARETLDAMKDELRELMSYQVELKGLLFNKSIDSMKGTTKGWNPNAELDTGRDVARMAKALPPDVMNRLLEAQSRILAAQDSLLHAIPPKQQDDVRDKIAAGQDRDALAKDLGCSVEEIDEIRLTGKPPAGLAKEFWPIVRRKHEEAEKKAELCRKNLGRAEDAAKAGAGKPKTIQAKLQQNVKHEQQAVSLAEAAIEKLHQTMATKYGVTVEVIVDILGWQPCFTDFELRNELWKPLVREGVIPDNVVPDRYNETAQQFKGANELYQERLNDEFYGKDEPAKVDKALAEAKYATGQATKIADAIVKAAGGPAIVGTAISATSVITQGTLSTIQAVRAKDFEGGLNAVGDILGKSVDLALGGSKDGKALAGVIKSSYLVAVKGAVTFNKIMRTDPPDWKGAVNAIGDAIATSLSLCGDTPEQKKMFAMIGARVKDAFVGAITVADLIKNLREDPPNIQGCVKALGGATQHAFGRVMAGVAADQTSKLEMGGGKVSDKELTGDALTKEQKRLAAGLKKVSLSDAFGQLGDVAKATKALKKAEAAEHKKQMDDELNSWRTQLVLGFGGDSGDEDAIKVAAEQGNIDKMIAQINRDRALLKMAEQIFSTGVKTASQFLAPLRAADHAKEFVKQMIMAVRRAIELSEWVDLNRKALKACSVQGFAFANRVLNLKVQVSKRTLDSIMELQKLIGAGVETAGQISSGSGFGAALIPAGRAIEHSAQAAQALIDTIYNYAEKARLSRQWKKYLRCIENPYDRAQMRDVIAGNPTLSKYAMAYAAVVEDDVIAKEGMKTCGLGEAALKNPNTNAMKVVSFLETKLNDDPQLIRKLSKKDWQADKGELTLTSWMANKQAAVKHLKLANATGTGVIENNITQFDNALRDLETAKYGLKDARRNFEANQGMFAPRLQQLEGSLTAFERQREHLETLSAAYDSAQQDYSSAATPTEAQVDLFKNALADYTRGLRDMIQLGGELQGQTKKQFLEAVQPFSDAADRYLQAADPQPFTAVKSAADRLAASFRGFKPLRQEGKEREACPEFSDFCEAMATLTEIKSGNVQKESADFQRVKDEAKDAQEEATEFEKELQGKRFQDIATAVAISRAKMQSTRKQMEQLVVSLRKNKKQAKPVASN